MAIPATKNTKEELFFLLLKHINRILEHTANEYRGGFTQNTITPTGIIETYIQATHESLSNAIDGLLASTTYLMSEETKEKLKELSDKEQEELKEHQENEDTKSDWFNTRVSIKLKQYQLVMEEIQKTLDAKDGEYFEFDESAIPKDD